MHTRRSIEMLCAHFLCPLSFVYGLVSKRSHFCVTANHYCCSLREQKNKNAINGHPSKLFVVSPKYSCTHTNCCVQYADSHKAQSRYIFNHIPPFDACAPSHPVWSLCVLLYVICTDDMTHR